MAGVLAFVVSRWSLTLIGTALLCGLVWLFGPLLPALEDWLPRAGIVVAMLAIWAAANLLLDLRRRGRDAALARGVAAGAGGGAAEEAAGLRDKLAVAMALLRKHRRSRGYLYEQPWYAIIGPPGAGKTTALLNAGLHFPLAAEMGQGAVAGVGGTRQCDWWFTDTAVLIDTAGRYTTQDSDATIDRAGWEAFLDLLKTTRPRQPLNGVIVAIALSDIAQAPDAERMAHARAVRARVDELETRLGVRMPVYALFTKADLIAGFSEFFDDLDTEGRAQVWGATFSLAAADEAAFAREFRLLLDRLDRRAYDRLQSERNIDRRALIAGFAAQVATLEQPLAEFMQAAFAPATPNQTRPAKPPLLRGVYFTSGTQEGTPIDRLTGAMARAFGLDQRRMPSLRPEQGRSYFLRRLLGDVIFGEAMLVSEPPGASRRRLMLRLGAFAVLLLAVIGAGAALARRHIAEQAQMDAAAAALAAYEQTTAGLPLDPVADADLPRLAPLLDQARALPSGLDADPATGRSWLGLGPLLGMSQSGKLAAGERAVYRHALDNTLLPRLIWRLEAQMRGAMNRPDFLYEATRIYLMLGGAGPLDRDLVREWMGLDWATAYPGPANAPLRESLLRHLDALLAAPLPEIALDGDLVAAARATFGRVSLAQRVYSRIRPSEAAQRVAPWRPSEVLGPAGVNLFVRASGRKLSDGIPGFYTVAGFHSVLLPSLPAAERRIADEGWVLGQRAGFDPNGPQARALEQDVLRLYEAEYAQEWDAMLADLNVVPLCSLVQAAQDLYILASLQYSPIRALLASAARQLTLSVAPGSETKTPATADATPSAGGSGLNVYFGVAQANAAAAAAATLPGHEIDERYKALRDLVGDGPGAPIDQVLRSLGVLQQQLAKLAAAGGGAAATQAVGEDPALALRTEGQRQPQPLGRWLLAMSGSGTALRSGGAKLQVVAAYNAPGGPAALCPAAVAGRYPFTAPAGSEISMEDFGKLFSPGGLIDGFVNTQLRPYVDMTTKPWRALTTDGVAAPVTAADLAQFQRAAAIRDMFFGVGGTTPEIRFDLTPVSVDAGTTQVTLDLDGTLVATRRGEPPRSTQITWPGPNKTLNARLTFDPPPAGGVALQESGPWALLRLFGDARMQPATAAGTTTLTFQSGDRRAAFEIHTATAANPFAPAVLRDFRCPSVQ